MKRLAITLAALVLLAGCGGANEATPTPTPPTPPPVVEGEPTTTTTPTEAETTPQFEQWTAADGPATFKCADVDSGIIYSYSLPTDETHEGVQIMERLRESLKIAPKPNYLVVEIDATKASDGGGIYEVSWATTEQTSQNAVSPDDTLGAWRDKAGGTENPDAYNAVIEVTNKLYRTPPNVGAKGYELMVTERPITSMVAPMVYPSIFGSSACVKVA